MHLAGLLANHWRPKRAGALAAVQLLAGIAGCLILPDSSTGLVHTQKASHTIHSAACDGCPQTVIYLKAIKSTKLSAQHGPKPFAASCVEPARNLPEANVKHIPSQGLPFVESLQFSKRTDVSYKRRLTSNAMLAPPGTTTQEKRPSDSCTLPSTGN